MTVSGIKTEGGRRGREEKGRERGWEDLSHQRTCGSPPVLYGGEPCEGIDGYWDECYVEPCDSKWYKKLREGEGEKEGGREDALVGCLRSSVSCL